MNDQQWTDLKDIGELATAGYWANKVARGDVDNSEGRIMGSTYVRNHAEYAAVAAGQISVGHLIFGVLAKCVLVPFWIVTLLLMEFGVSSLLAPSGSLLNPAIMFVVFLVWLYVFGWRLTLKPILRWLFRHGPSITPADGYRGPLGTVETTHTGWIDTSYGRRQIP